LLDHISIEYYTIPSKKEIVIANDSIRTIVVLAAADFTEESKELLFKILSAVKCGQSNTEIIQLEDNESINILQTQTDTCVEHVIVFGLPPKQLSLAIDVTYYQPLIFTNFSTVFSKSLSELMTHPDHKKALWGALKKLYSA